MIDTDTFLTTLYVIADDFTKLHTPAAAKPGPCPSLTASEVITLALFSQWQRFSSERDFYRFADRHLRPAFPRLSCLPQFNRLLRANRRCLAAFCLHLADRLGVNGAPFEVLDCTPVVTRHVKRGGQGWLFGQADVGKSTRLGWFEGLRLLTAVSPEGVLTGYGFGPASAKDQPLAETLLALRADRSQVIASVGKPAAGCYLLDTGFEGEQWHERWLRHCGAAVLCPPKSNSPKAWASGVRRRFSRLRQVVETVNEKLHNQFRLSRERPHRLQGFEARLAAKAALHNFCIWFNEQVGRPKLAFADLIDW